MQGPLPFVLRRKQFWWLLIFGGSLLFFEIFFHSFKQNHRSPFQETELLAFLKNKEEPEIALEAFDPNVLDIEGWQKLGFTPKQAATIVNYRTKVFDGIFTTKEQIAKCFAISPEKFAQLEPFILLKATAGKTKSFASSNFKNKKLNIPGKFNPDQVSQAGWQQMGFSEKQAAAILKYKAYLGGSFRSKEKFKACYMISEDHYRQLESFILLPEREAAANSSFAENRIGSEEQAKFQSKPKVQDYFDPNDLPLEAWVALGFSEKQA